MKNVHFNWKGILGLTITLGSLLSHPEILNLLPERWAVIGSIVGAAIQAATNPAARRYQARAVDVASAPPPTHPYPQ